MLALSSPALRGILYPRCSALYLGCATMSGKASAVARPPFLKTQTALFHQSKARAARDPDKPASGKDILYGCLFSETVS